MKAVCVMYPMVYGLVTPSIELPKWLPSVPFAPVAFKTDYRGPIVICSSHNESMMRERLVDEIKPRYRHILATAFSLGTIEIIKSGRNMSPDWVVNNPYATSKYALLFENIRRVYPISFPTTVKMSHMCLFELPDGFLKRLKYTFAIEPHVKQKKRAYRSVDSFCPDCGLTEIRVIFDRMIGSRFVECSICKKSAAFVANLGVLGSWKKKYLND